MHVIGRKSSTSPRQLSGPSAALQPVGAEDEQREVAGKAWADGGVEHPLLREAKLFGAELSVEQAVCSF